MTESYDQTQFISEEPLYEVTQKKATEPQPNQATGKSKKLKLIVVPVISVFVLLLLVVVYTAMNRPPAAIPDEDVEPVENSVEMGPYRQQLDELSSQLQAADPAKDELPFPPINMSIQLEEGT